MQDLKRVSIIISVILICTDFSFVPVLHAYPSFLTEEKRNVEFAYEWRCFKRKDIHYRCDSSEVEDPKNALMMISVDAPGGKHKYIGRRVMPMSFCVDYIWTWHRLMKNQKEVCLLGTCFDCGKQNLPFQYRDWTWEQLLTAKGCVEWLGQKDSAPHAVPCSYRPERRYSAPRL